MVKRTGRLVIATLALGGLLWGSAARADIPPDPRRPTWDEHPAPMPDPPPEKPLVWVLATALLGLGGIAVAARSKRPGVRRAARIGEAS